MDVIYNLINVKKSITYTYELESNRQLKKGVIFPLRRYFIFCNPLGCAAIGRDPRLIFSRLIACKLFLPT